MSELDFTKARTRQFELVPEAILTTPITIVGAGAIGSFTALSLAKMGFEDITVIDFDSIEIENMNSQFYRFSDIGKPKVEALRDLVKDFTGIDIKAQVQRYEGKDRFKGIVVSAVDSMKVRRSIWEAHEGKAPWTNMIIDPRMGAETAMLYAMNPMCEKDIEGYQACLYTDEEAAHERCTAKAIMYTATMLSGLVAKTVKDVAAKVGYARTATWSIKNSQFQAWIQEPAPALT